VFGGDGELLAGIAPLVAAVAATVVGQYPLDGDPAGTEPGVGTDEESGGGLAGLVGVDFGVGQPGVVVDGGVDVAVADQRVVMAADPTA
jgi:hypothetical protein